MPRIKKTTTVVEKKKKSSPLKSKKGKADVKKTEKLEKTKEIKKYFYATGKRKTAIARVRFFPEGSGIIIINGKSLEKYFPYISWQKTVLAPLELLQIKNYDLKINVKRGGLQAQAESIRLGLAKNLVQLNSEFRKALKPKGFLSRDSRVKERKKPGLKRARRAPQWKKR